MGSSHTGFVDAVAGEVLNGGLIVRAKGLLQVGVLFQICCDAEGGTGLTAFLGAVVQEVLIQLVSVGAEGLLQVGVFVGIVGGIKHQRLDAVGDPVVLAGVLCAGGAAAGAAAGAAGRTGVLVVGAANVSDVSIADGIGLFTHGATVGGNRSGAGVAFNRIDGAVGITGNNTNMVGSVGVTRRLEINDVTGLRGIVTLSDSGSGISQTALLEPGQAGGGVGVLGNDGSRNTCHVCAPGHKHSTPHILHAVPAAVLGVVAAAVALAGKLRGRAAFLIANLRFCDVDDVCSLVSSELHIFESGIVFTGLVGRRPTIANCICRNRHQLHAHYCNQT